MRILITTYSLFLQEQELERVGSSQSRHVDVRIVAATNQDLETLVAEKRVRMDFYYRINVFPIALPPLRRHHEDIPMLVAHFVEKYSARMSKQISRASEEGMDILMRLPAAWNIRELQNFIERAVILTQGEVLQLTPQRSSRLLTRTEPIT